MTCYTKEKPEGTIFFCQKGGVRCGQCQWMAEYLCDHPIGDGRTCDKTICNDHANHISDDVHYCNAHYDMHIKKAASR